jgi:hypothetical protein
VPGLRQLPQLAAWIANDTSIQNAAAAPRKRDRGLIEPFRLPFHNEGSGSRILSLPQEAGWKPASHQAVARLDLYAEHDYTLRRLHHATHFARA